MANNEINVSLLESLKIDTTYKVDADSKSVLLASAELTEENGSQIVTVFEAAVNQQAKELTEQVAAKYEEILEAKVVQVRQEIQEQVSDYLEEIVEEFFNENKVQIAEGLQAKNNNALIGAILKAFGAHYIEIPEDRKDILEELSERVKELEGELNESELVSKHLQLQVAGAKCERVVDQLSEDMADTDKERFVSLVQDLDIDNPEVFEEKATILKKTFFKQGKSNVETTESLNHERANDKTKSPASDGKNDIAKAAAILNRKQK